MKSGWAGTVLEDSLSIWSLLSTHATEEPSDLPADCLHKALTQMLSVLHGFMERAGIEAPLYEQTSDANRFLDDLAGLDNEEHVELLGQHGLSDDGEAGDIIMAARAHWFEDEDAAESKETADDTDTGDQPAVCDS